MLTQTQYDALLGNIADLTAIGAPADALTSLQAFAAANKPQTSPSRLVHPGNMSTPFYLDSAMKVIWKNPGNVKAGFPGGDWIGVV